MKYLIFFLKQILKFIKGIFMNLKPYFLFTLVLLFCFWAEGYTWEDIGLDGFSLNPNDYCNITDVNYTAILQDNPNGKANVEITEYITFDVHAGSKSNTYKELWRELPEEYVDGLRVTYDVKSVTQIMEDGRQIPYRETSKMYWEDEDFTESSTYYWHHSEGSGRYPDNDESVLIYIPWTYREKMTFKIVYSMNNAALKYRDCSELYLSMYSGNTITKLKSYKAQILIPNNLMPSTYYTYTFGTSKTRIPYNRSDTINPGFCTFTIDLDKSDLKFNYYNRYIEFCLLTYGNDKHIFTKYAPNNLYSNYNVLDECLEENNYYATQNQKINTYKTLLLIVSIFISILVIYTAKEKCRKTKEKYNLFEPRVEYDYYKEIPSDLDPIFASELVFSKDPFSTNIEKGEEYAAILLSLMRKKYVKLTRSDNSRQWDSHNTVITVEPTRTETINTDSSNTIDYITTEPIYRTINENTGDILEPLTTSERLYLDLLERYTSISMYSKSITVAKLQNSINFDYQYVDSFVKDMERKPGLEAGVMQGYFQDTDYNVAQREIKGVANLSLAFGVTLLIVNLISYFTPLSLCFGAYTILGIILLWKYVYLTIKANDFILFTQYGVDEREKWYGLYKFLNSDNLINEINMNDIDLLEKYVIYATAFGISNKIVNSVKLNAIKLNINTSLILNEESYIHSRHYRRTSRSFGHSIHTSSRGGGFGGHGYGGGGRGGGGGGGGH